MRTDTNTQMKQILSDKDYKASIIKSDPKSTYKFFETNIQNISKEIEIIF